MCIRDSHLFPFTTLRATGVADAQGDRAFDEDDSCATSSAAGPASDAVVTLLRAAPGDDLSSH